MAPPSDAAKAYKDQLVEWALRTMHHGYVDNIGASTLPHHSSFDPSFLGGESGPYFMHGGAGLTDVLNDTVCDQGRVEGLKINLMAILDERDKRYDSVRAEIVGMLEEEIRTCDRPNCCAQNRDQIDQLNLNSKVRRPLRGPDPFVARVDHFFPSLSLVAKHRMTANLNLLEQVDPSNEYQVLLCTLISGSGNCDRSTKLFFDYRSSFPTFLASLREATQHSKIPPKDLSAEIAFWSAIDAGDLNPDTGSSFTSSTTMANSSDQSETTPGQTISFRSNPEMTESDDVPSPTMPKSHYDEGHGYTLGHGPWSYRFVKDKQVQTDWKDIHDEKGYVEMLKELKEGEAKKAVDHLLLMHSKDKKCKYQQKALDALNQAASAKDLEYYQSLDWPEEEDDDDIVEYGIGYKKDNGGGNKDGNRQPSFTVRPKDLSFAK